MEAATKTQRAMPELWSVAEIADHLQVARSTVHHWQKHEEKFPEPVARLATGPVWNAQEVRHWRMKIIRERRRRRRF